MFSQYEFQKQKDARASKLSAHKSLFGKSAGKVLRYSGILHILWSYASNRIPSQYIPIWILQVAIRLSDLMDANTIAMHSKVASKTTTGFSAFTRRIHELASKSKLPVTWADIRKQMNSMERKGKTVDDARKSMEELEAAGVGKIVNGGRGGLSYQVLKPLP